VMDALFSSLVDYLQLDNAYNVFILNPKHDLKRAKYGYRCVFFKDIPASFYHFVHNFRT
jgi:hypothetical protein